MDKDPQDVTPFRWSFAKREQLGGLLGAAPRPDPPYPEFHDDLRHASAQILAFAEGADLAFVGRSLESVYDYLSGAFSGRPGAPKLRLLPFSLRWVGPGGLKALPRESREGFFAMLASDGLGPSAIAAAPRPIALCDYVCGGGTMENLLRLLKAQAEQERADWAAVARRLRILGLRGRTKNSPNTWRWQQNQEWLDLIPETPIKNVSAPYRLVYEIANVQPKVTEAHHPGRWAGAAGRPVLDDKRLRALAVAASLYDRGQSEREALAALLARPRHMRRPETRRLIASLRGRAQGA